MAAVHLRPPPLNVQSHNPRNLFLRNIARKIGTLIARLFGCLCHRRRQTDILLTRLNAETAANVRRHHPTSPNASSVSSAEMAQQRKEEALARSPALRILHHALEAAIKHLVHQIFDDVNKRTIQVINDHIAQYQEGWKKDLLSSPFAKSKEVKDFISDHLFPFIASWFIDNIDKIQSSALPEKVVTDLSTQIMNILFPRLTHLIIPPPRAPGLPSEGLQIDKIIDRAAAFGSDATRLLVHPWRTSPVEEQRIQTLATSTSPTDMAALKKVHHEINGYACPLTGTQIEEAKAQVARERAERQRNSIETFSIRADAHLAAIQTVQREISDKPEEERPAAEAEKVAELTSLIHSGERLIHATQTEGLIDIKGCEKSLRDIEKSVKERDTTDYSFLMIQNLDSNDPQTQVELLNAYKAIHPDYSEPDLTVEEKVEAARAIVTDTPSALLDHVLTLANEEKLRLRRIYTQTSPEFIQNYFSRHPLNPEEPRRRELTHAEYEDTLNVMVRLSLEETFKNHADWQKLHPIVKGALLQHGEKTARLELATSLMHLVIGSSEANDPASLFNILHALQLPHELNNLKDQMSAKFDAIIPSDRVELGNIKSALYQAIKTNIIPHFITLLQQPLETVTALVIRQQMQTFIEGFIQPNQLKGWMATNILPEISEQVEVLFVHTHILESFPNYFPPLLPIILGQRISESGENLLKPDEQIIRLSEQLSQTMRTTYNVEISPSSCRIAIERQVQTIQKINNKDDETAARQALLDETTSTEKKYKQYPGLIQFISRDLLEELGALSQQGWCSWIVSYNVPGALDSLISNGLAPFQNPSFVLRKISAAVHRQILHPVRPTESVISDQKQAVVEFTHAHLGPLIQENLQMRIMKMILANKPREFFEEADKDELKERFKTNMLQELRTLFPTPPSTPSTPLLRDPYVSPQPLVLTGSPIITATTTTSTTRTTTTSSPYINTGRITTSPSRSPSLAAFDEREWETPLNLLMEQIRDAPLAERSQIATSMDTIPFSQVHIEQQPVLLALDQVEGWESAQILALCQPFLKQAFEERNLPGQSLEQLMTRVEQEVTAKLQKELRLDLRGRVTEQDDRALPSNEKKLQYEQKLQSLCGIIHAYGNMVLHQNKDLSWWRFGDWMAKMKAGVTTTVGTHALGTREDLYHLVHTMFDKMTSDTVVLQNWVYHTATLIATEGNGALATYQ